MSLLFFKPEEKILENVKTSNEFRGLLVDTLAGLHEGSVSVEESRAAAGVARQVNSSLNNDLRRMKIEAETGLRVDNLEIR